MTNRYTPLGIRKIILRVEKRSGKTSKEIDAIRDAIINGDKEQARKYGIPQERIPDPMTAKIMEPVAIVAKPGPSMEKRIMAAIELCDATRGALVELYKEYLKEKEAKNGRQ